MNSLRLNVGLLLLAVLLAIGAGLRWRRTYSAAIAIGGEVALIPAVEEPRFFNPDSLDRAVRTTVAGDPFRIANRPSRIPFASTLVPVSVGGAPQAHSGAPRPSFLIRAIMGGPPWSAIVDGMPGEGPGLVVNPGAVFGSFHVVSVTSDTVVVQGPDTTWRLTMLGGGS